MKDGLNPEVGRTIVFRGKLGEVVVSSSYKSDSLKIMVTTLKDILDGILVEGGDVSYVD